MTAKDRLRSLVDELSEEEAASALVVVERRRADPMLHALANAQRTQARSRHRLNEPWTYAVTPPARRDLRRLDPPVQRRITNAWTGSSQTPTPVTSAD
jgi:hypothetical protein